MVVRARSGKVLGTEHGAKCPQGSTSHPHKEALVEVFHRIPAQALKKKTKELIYEYEHDRMTP
jgi:hypothetical protein